MISPKATIKVSTPSSLAPPSYLLLFKSSDLSLPLCLSADAANITLFEPFDSYRADTDLYNRFERFDIEEDEDTQLNFTAQVHSQIPTTLVPSPLQEEPQQADEIQDQHPEPPEKQLSDEYREEAGQPQQDERRKAPTKRRARKRPASFVMDYEQTIIAGHVYQSWLQNPADIASGRGRKRKRVNPIFTMKKIILMDLPPVALINGLSTNETMGIHYPAPLLELWARCTQIQPARDSPPGRTLPPQPPEPSSSSVPNRPLEDFHSGVGSEPLGVSIEKQRTNLDNFEVPPEILIEELRTNLKNTGMPVNEANLLVTPGNSGEDIRSIPSSASGHGFLSHNSEVHSGRSNKRPYSASRHSGSLEPVAEENPWQQPEPDFKLARLPENGPEHELLVETGPTQTPHPIISHSIDKITDSIRKHLKTHFDTPGAPQLESLNQLATGMNRKKASQLFYQTCVLASHDLLRVEQKTAYGDILISRGAKM
ncbi:hypothetical protein HHK36_016137 [Tetracentron sinense]|uniref:Rad21/Rec8-like protein C-terminal eukaryotic domain-containing protein n=1 Tax=Tetracentron sinense TaxID=13715 RepID=A0A834YZQ5_TETSI|nr:hypothetical protein HHK36_016137 [Tetracentron sinense]